MEESKPGGGYLGAGRLSYGHYKAYEARRNNEMQMYNNGASVEDVAILRSINENYGAISKNIGVMYEPEFLSNAMSNYYLDELAFEEFAMTSELAANGDSAFINHIQNLAARADSDESIQAL
jgi:hypothetical protein